MKKVQIKDIGKIVSGSTPKSGKKEYWNGDISWVSPKEISALESPFLNTTERKITKAGYNSSSTTLLPKNSILFTSRAPIGLVAINTMEVCTNQGFKSIILNDKAFPLYIYYILKASVRQLNSLGTGTTFKELSKSTLENFKIPLPSLDDQIKITIVLEKVRKLISERKKSIKLLDELIKSLFLEVFGDPTKNKKGWMIAALKDMVHDDCPLAYGIIQPGEEYNNGIPIVRPVDLNGEAVYAKGLKRINPEISKKFKRTVLNGSEILISVRGTTGQLGYATEELIGANVTRGITPIFFKKDIDKYFAFGLFSTDQIQREIQKRTYGSTLQQINLKDLRELKLIKPTLKKQLEYTTTAKKIETLKLHFKNSLNELENLFESLNQIAFKGELDLGNLDIDHIISKSKGGSDNFENLQTIPKLINKPKTQHRFKKSELEEKNWNRISISQLSDWLKIEFAKYHFTSEMLIKYLIDEKKVLIPKGQPLYYSSEEVKKKPKLDVEKDLKKILYDALSGKSPFLKLEQIYYNGEKENIKLRLRKNDSILISNKSKKERSGIYLKIKS